LRLLCVRLLLLHSLAINTATPAAAYIRVKLSEMVTEPTCNPCLEIAVPRTAPEYTPIPTLNITWGL
jgi:hypothetical protein